MSVKPEDARRWTELGFLGEKRESPDLNRRLPVGIQSTGGREVSNEAASTTGQSLPLCS